MNIRPEHGQSYRLEFAAYGPGLRGKPQKRFFESYRKSASRFHGSETYSAGKFRALIGIGAIVCCEVTIDDEHMADFGLELLEDNEGPFLGLLFFEGKALRLYVRDMVGVCFSAVKANNAALGFEGEGRLRICGWSGWPRVLSRLGLIVDENGFIREFQPAFGWKG